ncbi:MAG TPA: PspC domain-containing protein [Mycobacteriales bacterium]
MTIRTGHLREAPIANTPAHTPPRRAYRSVDGRIVAGVAQGLAEHLRIAPAWVRAGFILLAAVKGFGLVLYGAYWVVLPKQSADDTAPRRGNLGRLAAFGLLAVGLVLLWQRARPFVSDSVLYAGMLVGGGVALIWWQADEAQRERLLEITGRTRSAAGGQPRSAVALRLAAGSGLVVVGLAAFVFQAGGLVATRDAAVATSVVVLGAALISGPWWWRVVQVLAAERRERIRSQERADLAAHLHDSVLHTLALIQRHSDSPREVSRLARGQERELRSWLYRTAPAGTTARLSAALEAVTAEVEDAYAVAVEAVVVGDAEMDERLGALVQATREALVNAARHAGVAEVSLYAEVEPGRVSVYVRDRGVGFDRDAVPVDRHGIDGSIIGRMRRHGGSAAVRSGPGAGTEVELSMELGG